MTIVSILNWRFFYRQSALIKSEFRWLCCQYWQQYSTYSQLCFSRRQSHGQEFLLSLKGQFPGFAYVGFKGRILGFGCCAALTPTGFFGGAEEIAAEETRPWGREALSCISLYHKREHSAGVAGDMHHPCRLQGNHRHQGKRNNCSHVSVIETNQLVHHQP